MGHVHDVQQDVGLADLLQGRAERLDELVRQGPDEAHGVAEGVGAPVRRLRAPDRGVQGREQRVLHQHPGAGEPVEQAGLARVGVPGDRDRGHVVPAPPRAAGDAGRCHRRDLAPQLGHPGPDPAAVQLDLGLTGATRADARAAGDPPTGLPGHRVAPTAQPREQVLQLGELDLRLALLGLGVLGEDVQDQRGPVDHLDLDDVLERTTLGWRELTVHDHGVRPRVRDQVGELGGLARAQVGTRVRVGAALQQPVEHLRARRLGQRGELAQRHLGLGGVAARLEPDQHDPLQAQLPVLDLGDVGELGGQARDAAQRGALLAVQLLAVALLGTRVDLVDGGTPGAREHPRDDVVREAGGIEVGLQVAAAGGGAGRGHVFLSSPSRVTPRHGRGEAFHHGRTAGVAPWPRRRSARGRRGQTWTGGRRGRTRSGPGRRILPGRGSRARGPTRAVGRVRAWSSTTSPPSRRPPTSAAP